MRNEDVVGMDNKSPNNETRHTLEKETIHRDTSNN